VTSHYIECLIIKKEEQICHRPKPKLPYGIQPEELQDILNKYTQEQKTYSREITRKRKRKNVLPRPSHNVYIKIIIPLLSEGSLPRALCCIKPNEIFSHHGRNRILRAGNTSAPHNGRPGKRTSLHTTDRNRKKGKGREGGITWQTMS
jgi:hypothetical protein